jgi:hypothetical protein
MQNLSRLGSNPNKAALRMALSRAEFITRRGKPGQYRYIQKHSPTAMAQTTDVLPAALIKALAKDFRTEIADLRHNFGPSGTCTAFLLRKILEKLIFIAFAKNGQEAKLYDPNRRLHGLHTMLTLATSCKVGGKPFLMQKTADEAQAVKFLGDTAAHNYLCNVLMKTIQPVMPYIITAYSELAVKL